jgi:hypothetical protein
VSPSAGSADRAAESSALWARSVAVNLLALFLCRLLLGGFEIHGVEAYAFAAVGIELPTALWWLALHFWHSEAFSQPLVMRARASAGMWTAGVIALTLVVPLALATCAPGLLVADWISSLDINGFWTYVAASAITAGLTIAFRQSRPLRFVLRYLDSPASEQQRAKSKESNRAFRDSILQWWYTHRKGIRWAERCMRVGAVIAGTVAVGLWFGLVLGVAVWLLPAAILWPLVRSREDEQRSGATPSG